MSRKFFFVALIFLAAFAINYIAVGSDRGSQTFRLRPQLVVEGYYGNFSYAEGQMFLPIFGGENQAFYWFGEGNKDDEEDSALGFGLGYRQVFNEQIFGTYLIADNRSTASSSFWILNTGFEMLGDIWNFNFNAYLPLTGKKVIANDEEDSDGDDDSGSNNYQKLNHRKLRLNCLPEEIEEAAQGFEFEFGRVVPKFENATIYIGAYYFSTEQLGSLQGAKARFTYDFNPYVELEIDDQYDKRFHNQFLIGFNFMIGAYSEKAEEQFGMATRLLESITHYSPIFNSED